MGREKLASENRDRQLPVPEVVGKGIVVRVVSNNKTGPSDEERFLVVILNLKREVDVARLGDPISKIIGLREGESADIGEKVFTVEEIVGRLD